MRDVRVGVKAQGSTLKEKEYSVANQKGKNEGRDEVS